MSIVHIMFVLIASTATIMGCTERNSIDYPRNWNQLNAADSCPSFEGDFADRGAVAEPETALTQSLHASFLQLVESGSISEPSLTSRVHVQRFSSGRINVSWLNGSGSVEDVDLADDRCEHGGSKQAASHCDSGGPVSLCFFIANDGSLVVEELARQPDVAWLAIPAEEEYQYWFRFTRAS